MRSIATALVFTALAAASARGQHVHERSMYADQTDSGIAALSLEEYQALQAGEGMGLARAAELNHFPGPLHVLEMGDSLGLSVDQRSAIEKVRATMLERAIDLGGRIIEAERTLDTRFKHGHIDDTTLRDAIGEIARMQGELRYTHLAAHLEVQALLSPEQVTAYDRLRGYGGEHGSEYD